MEVNARMVEEEQAWRENVENKHTLLSEILKNMSENWQRRREKNAWETRTSCIILAQHHPFRHRSPFKTHWVLLCEMLSLQYRSTQLTAAYWEFFYHNATASSFIPLLFHFHRSNVRFHQQQSFILFQGSQFTRKPPLFQKNRQILKRSLALSITSHDRFCTIPPTHGLPLKPFRYAIPTAA